MMLLIHILQENIRRIDEDIENFQIFVNIETIDTSVIPTLDNMRKMLETKHGI